MKKILSAITAAALCVSLTISLTACNNNNEEVNNYDAATPVITQQPQSIQLRKDEETRGLEVKAYTIDNGSLSYQWYNSASDGSDGTKIDGATKSVYDLDTTVAGTAYYYCVVTNTNILVGGKQTASATSEVATVEITYSAETPRITEQPKSGTYVYGAQSEVLPIGVEAAVAKGTLSYQWYTANASDGEFTAINGATSNKYVPYLSGRGEKYYYCEITNTDGEQKSSVKTKTVCISVDYAYSAFTFEELSDTTCKLTKYDGESLYPFIPDTDEEGRAVVEIGPGVFAGLPIVEVTIPDTVEKIGWANPSVNDSDGAFYNCTSLREVHYNGHFKYLGDFTFSKCSALETNVWEFCDRLETLTSGVFQQVTLPKNMVIPNTLTGTLRNWTFQNCKGAVNITFEEGSKITKIEGSVFAGISSLETIVIPASVTAIEDALKNDAALTSVTFERSAVTDGSITSGNPFSGTYENLKIYVPEDSYTQYYGSIGSPYNEAIVAPETDEKFTLTVIGATIDGKSVIKLDVDETLPADADVSYNSEDCLGWMYNGRYYETYEELVQAFKMSFGDALVQAVYAEDFTQVFTPCCRTEKIDGGDVKTMEHETVDGINGLATRYVYDGAYGIKITNGYGEPHDTDNLCPVSPSYKTCILMSFTNNSDEAITVRYVVDAWGDQGSVTVELAARETKTALLVSKSGGNDTDQPFHKLYIENGGENGYDLTIYGLKISPEYTLTVEGATIDGNTSMKFKENGKLDANSEVVYEKDNVLGWACDGIYYADFADLAANFKMGGGDTTVKAVYAEDFIRVFTPSCSSEKMNGGATAEMAHESIDGIEGQATRYVYETKDDIKIMNGSLEAHGAEDGVYNSCPISQNGKTCILMTFTNNSDEAVTVRYEAEYWGVIGSVTVTLAAGETKTELLVIDAAKDNKDDAFHQLRIVEGGENGYDITIYGQRLP